MIFLLSSIAMAQPELTNLKKGQRAPYDGRLFNTEAVAEIISQKENAQTECDLNLEYQKSSLNTEHELEAKYLTADIEFEKEKNKQLLALRDKQIEKLQENYNPYRVVWWAIAGFTVGTLSSLGIYYSVVEINND
tara:strand:- start:110 stop:514 length:405 start_codon:yes stop_codon:yes gene_type:complete